VRLVCSDAFEQFAMKCWKVHKEMESAVRCDLNLNAAWHVMLCHWNLTRAAVELRISRFVVRS
jgi:hypothetical protein